MNVNNIDDRWNMVGNLINTCGSEEEKLAWGLCRGDSAEWKMKLEKLEQQKAELIEFVENIVDYEAGRVLREREILLNKYK